MRKKGILILIGIVLLISGLATYFLLYLAKTYQKFGIVKEVPLKKKKIEKIPTEAKLAPGKHTYEIITDKPKDPQIIEVEVDPLDVEFGKTQTVTAKIKTKADSVRAEDFVLGKAICDQKEIEFPLKLKKVEGKEELITTWQGIWEREKECTFEKNYQIKIFTKNIKGEDKVTISFGSSCPTPTDGQDYTVATSCIFFWSVNGVEKGNIIIPEGVTLTIGGGSVGKQQTIVFNPGYSITIDGSIALNKTPGYEGQIRKAYIWVGDSDSDTFYNYYIHTDPTNPPMSGAVRRYTLSSLDSPDCNDENAYVYQEVANLSLDKDQDYYTSSPPAIRCVGDGLKIQGKTKYYKDANGNFSWLVDSFKIGTDDCDDSDSTKWQIVNCYPDSDGDTYYSNTGLSICAGDSCPLGYSDTPGDDCCDSDANTHPGQTSYATSVNACGSWDYDCDSNISKNADCSGGLDSSDCSLSGIPTCMVWDSFLKRCILAMAEGYATCTVTNIVTKDCGTSWTKYYCQEAPCGDTKCGVMPQYLCASVNVTCGCR